MAATPIGNDADASSRLKDALESADLIAAEDTRRLLNLAKRLDLDLAGRVVSVHDHNETARIAEILGAAHAGETVVVVSDAGTPTVSDPGYHLVVAAVEEGVEVRPLPGPSAALAALSVSGLPTDRFVFEGFLPRKKGAARKALETLAAEERTVILFESPRRLADTLTLLSETMGAERKVAVCRELTKTHEEVVRGTLRELAEKFSDQPARGEITIVVEGAPQTAPADVGHLAKLAVALSKAQGIRLKEACAQVAPPGGPKRNAIFAEALKLSAE